MDGNPLICLPTVDTKENYLEGFWQWVELLAADDYTKAVESLYWPREAFWKRHRRVRWKPTELKEHVTTFFGGTQAWKVVIPNERLIKEVNEKFEYQARNGGKAGWFLGLIPLTNSPDDPRSDKIPLMGLAASFFVRPYQNLYVLEFEIFHA